MSLPKRAKIKKRSKYVPVYQTLWTWEQMYKHWVWPYVVEVRQIQFLEGNKLCLKRTPINP